MDVLLWGSSRLEEAKTYIDKHVACGQEYVYDGSRFQGFTSVVSSIEEINRGYEAMRATHMGARHIVCAFRLPGLCKAQMEDGCDDEEHGMARVLLNAMKHTDIMHRCLYVVRYYDGEQIGQERFVQYLLAARSAISHSSHNVQVNKIQVPWTEEDCSWLAKGKRFPPKGTPGDPRKGYGGTLRSRTRNRYGRGGRSRSRPQCQWGDHEDSLSEDVTSMASQDDTNYDAYGLPIGPPNTYADVVK